MNKYIDADKVIDYANQEVTAAFYYPQDGQRKQDEQAYRDKWAFVKQVMVAMPAADVVPRWIPVTERLPEKYGKYLVTVDMDYYAAVITLYYGRINCKDVFYDRDSEYGDIEYRGVIAWMPLPEPYKEGERNE